MNRLTARFLTVLVLVALPTIAYAQPKQGDREILLFGNLITVHSSGSTFTSGNIFANIGVFTSDSLEIGGGPSITVSGGGGGGVDTTVGVNGFLRRSFAGGNPKIVKYVGAELQVQDIAPSFGNASDQMFATGIAGLKNYFNEKAALDMKALFGVNLKHPGDAQIFGFTIGLTIIFP